VAEGTTTLAHLVQRRELEQRERRVARSAYAYGVDLRRSALLDQSPYGSLLLRGVDRGWRALLDRLASDFQTTDARSFAPWLVAELAELTRSFHTPHPGLRLLVPPSDRRETWPLCTPLGTTNGGLHLLVLDAHTLATLPQAMRRFYFASALAHLQCDHGPWFTACLGAGRLRRAVRLALAPWTRLATFSADRAGLLAAGRLDTALSCLEALASPPWYPIEPSLALRRAAIVDFDRSAIVRRARGGHASSPLPDDAEVAREGTDDPAAAEPDATSQASQGDRDREPWSLARCDARLTRRLGLL